jgi:peptide deformylase
MVTIVQKDSPLLRQKAKEVPPEEITGPRIQKILQKMREALASQEDGVALAAPQIGEPLRIFIVSEKAFLEPKEGDTGLTEYKAPPRDEHLVFINPEITKLSQEKKFLEEGCLSVRWLYGKVRRAAKAEVQAYDENGKRFKRGGSGLLAQIFQHEIDHLDGVLFIDKAYDIQEIPPNHDHSIEAGTANPKATKEKTDQNKTASV